MKPIEQRLWAKVEKTEGCWQWNGAKNTQGYGKIGRGSAKDGVIAVHRLSYELAFGPIPHGKYILHKCDSSACVKPEHLFVGTQTENLADIPLRVIGLIVAIFGKIMVGPNLHLFKSQR